MKRLLQLSSKIDRGMAAVGRIAAWLALALVCVVLFDVAASAFGMPRFLGLTAVRLQELETWLHTGLFAGTIGSTYIADKHVRVDWVAERFSERRKAWLEALGCAFLLLPVCAFAGLYSAEFAWQSFIEGDVSNSGAGLAQVWIHKAMLPLLFALLALAGLSRLIKSVAVLRAPVQANRG